MRTFLGKSYLTRSGGVCLLWGCFLALVTATGYATVNQGNTSMGDPVGQPGTRYPTTGVTGTVSYAVLAPGDALYSTLAPFFIAGAGSPSTLASNQYIYLYEVINDGPWEIWSTSVSLGLNLGSVTSYGYNPLFIPGNDLIPDSTASGPVPTDGTSPTSWGHFASQVRFTANGNPIVQGFPLNSGDTFGITTSSSGNRDNTPVSISAGTLVYDLSGQFLDPADVSDIFGFTATIPEPATGLLVGLGILGVLGMIRRRA